jgi:dihydrofolate synthase/folylpolyglutamate synthase
MGRSLADWLRWQESLSPHEIDLGLDRIRQVAERLPLVVPTGAANGGPDGGPSGGVFTVAGTNGKGSTASFLERLFAANDRRVGLYTSPHLVRYNERIRLNGEDVQDRRLVEAFETIETVRQDVPLTFFEFGTLAALTLFSQESCDVWILEVGLGGRLDAVNMIDPDFSLITTVAFDHQDWLGETLEEIAAEKAGILRPNRPGFYGDTEPPEAVVTRAAELGTTLHCLGREYAFEAAASGWSWRGRQVVLDGLPLPEVADAAQLRNASLALAATEACDPALLTPGAVAAALGGPLPAGRFQVVGRAPQWVLDVAHNPQAASVLAGRLDQLGAHGATTAVIGMLADKQVEPFIQALAGRVNRWIVAEVDDRRAADGAALAATIGHLTGQQATFMDEPNAAFERAVELTPASGRILCCGSFRIVGPALQWLGLY